MPGSVARDACTSLAFLTCDPLIPLRITLLTVVASRMAASLELLFFSLPLFEEALIVSVYC